MYLCSLRVVRVGDWLIKASSLDDQILIVCQNQYTMEVRFKLFYNEVIAHKFIESLAND